MLRHFICAAFLLTVLRAESVPPSAQGGFRIAGTVVHALTGQPLPQIQLSIILAQTPDALQTVNSDDSGHFAFKVSAAAKYVLVAEGRGFPRQAWDEHNGFSTAVATGPGKDSETIVFRVRPESSISGVVTDDANESVRDAQVLLFHRAAEEGNAIIHLREQTSTDDQGHYHFAHLFSGTFFIAVNARPWYAQSFQVNGKTEPDPLNVAYPITYFAGSTDSGSATPIAVRPGEKIIADVSLAAVPALQLEVTGLSKPEGNVSLNVTQKVFGEFSIPASSGVENRNDGRTFVGGIPPGETEISSISPENPRNSWKRTMNLAANSTLKISPGISSIAVSGRVVLGEARFSSGVVMLTDRSHGERIEASVKPDGSFQFSDVSIPPGTYQVAVYNLPGAVLSSIAATGAKVDGGAIEIPRGADVTLSLLMSKGVGRLDGTAMKGGKPWPGAMIVLLPRDPLNHPSLIRRDQSDSDGTFTLSQIAPGRYTVLALQNGWDLDWLNPALLAPYLPHADVLLMGPNQRYQMKINVQ